MGFKKPKQSNRVLAREPGYRRALYRILLVFVVPVVLILLGAGVLAYLFQGQKISLETVHTQIQSKIQETVGPDYTVDIAQSGLTLVSASALGLHGEGISIRSRHNGRELVNLAEVNIALDPWSIFSGAPRFNFMSIVGGQVSYVSDPDAGGIQSASPQELTPYALLTRLAKTLQSTEQAFIGGQLNEITFSQIAIKTPSFNKRIPNTIFLQRGRIAFGGERLIIHSSVEMDDDVFSIRSEWRPAQKGGRQLSIGIGELPFNWWADEIDPARRQILAIDGSYRLDARIPFTPSESGDLHPHSPFIRLQANKGKVKLPGLNTASLGYATASLSLSPEEGTITLENAEAELNQSRYRLNGWLGSLFEYKTQSTPQFNLWLEAVSATPATPTPGQSDLLARLAGRLDLENQRIDVSSLEVTKSQYSFTGSLSAGKKSGFQIKLTGDKADHHTILELWPDKLAEKARRWVKERVLKAAVSDMQLAANFTAERLKAIQNKQPLEPDELFIQADFSDVDLRFKDEMSPVLSAFGQLEIRGNQLTATSSKAKMQVKDHKPVSLYGASVKIAQMVTQWPYANIEVRAKGLASSLAAIANQPQIEALKPLAINADDLSGSGDVGLLLVVPIKKGQGKPDWKVSGKFSKVSVAVPLFEREIAQANFTLDADAKSVDLTGKARIDGQQSEIKLREPINGSDASLRTRNVKLKTSTRQLKAQGIDLAPIVSGPLSVEITRKGVGNDRYEIDLTHARLSIPWIAWSKSGKSKTPASVSFHLEKADGVTKLSDLSFEMTGGRKASGTLSFNKSGILTVDMTNVTLNKGDDFNVAIRRKNNQYEIKVNGRQFDGRPVLDMLLHGDGLSGSSSQTDIDLTANFGRLGGFHQEVMETALIRYHTRSGRLSLLSVKGAIRGAETEVTASDKRKVTTFRFLARNAGAALALLNLYEKMEGGKLTSTLERVGDGPFVGKVKVRKFTIVGEERLSSLTAAPAPGNLKQATGQLRDLNLKRVKFDEMKSRIVKAPNRLEVKDGRLRNDQIGLTFDGTLFDENERMNVRGTFMPLFAISRAIGEIPLIGDIFSNGKDSGLIGITYQLKGKSNNPQIAVNPLSIVAPGVFRELFEFKE